jgi:uncharacterized protein YndB with AHSA1/START domain
VTRVDHATRVISAPPATVYRAFAHATSLEAWLPPDGMTGEVRDFDLREGGGYRMRLTYGVHARGVGKTTDDADEVEVRFVRLVDDRLIEQAVAFDSDDASYGGVMTMTWSFRPVAGGTEVFVRATNVPPGITAADHAAGLASSLANLATYVEG